MWESILTTIAGAAASSFFGGGSSSDLYEGSGEVSLKSYSPGIGGGRTQITPAKKTPMPVASDYNMFVRQWEDYLTAYQRGRR